MIESKMEKMMRCYFGGSPSAPVIPPATPAPNQAAARIQNKVPNPAQTGSAQTILTGPTNLTQQEQNQKKTLLGS